MKDARIKSLQQRRYSEVSERQQERNRERVDHTADLLSELEERVDDDTERLETAKELISVAGSEVRTEGCNVALSDSLKLLRESAEDAGLVECYREYMDEMPNKTVSESLSAEDYYTHERGYDQRRREHIRTESDYNEHLANRGD